MKQWCSLILVVCVAAVGCQPAETSSSSSATPSSADVELETPEQRGSYGYGWGIGKQGSSMPLDHDALFAGIRDGLIGAESRMTEVERQQAMLAFSEIMTEARAGMGTENRAAGAAFLEDNARREGVRVTASGLQYEVLVEGDGSLAKETDVVKVLYRGTRINGDLFDETEPDNPSQFAVNQVIAGWTEGLQLMSLGSKHKLYIPTDLAYGDNPRPGGVIQPGDSLIFEVEIVEMFQR